MRWDCIVRHSCKYIWLLRLYALFACVSHLIRAIKIPQTQHLTLHSRLIINFIVPWGNFQAYLVRPDADEGPFSSCKQNHPSEKAWRKFMEGSTVSLILKTQLHDRTIHSASQFHIFDPQPMYYYCLGIPQQTIQAHPTHSRRAMDGKENGWIDTCTHRHEASHVVPWFDI